MKSGIYKITNLANEKIYIGQSVNVENRLKNHEKELKKDIHINYFLQKDFNEYGGENFKFEKIYECEEEFLNPMEKYFIDKYNTISNGYNIRNGNATISPKIKKEQKIQRELEEKRRNEQRLIDELSSIKEFQIELDEHDYILFKYCSQIDRLQYELYDKLSVRWSEKCSASNTLYDISMDLEETIFKHYGYIQKKIEVEVEQQLKKFSGAINIENVYEFYGELHICIEKNEYIKELFKNNIKTVTSNEIHIRKKYTVIKKA